MKTLYIVRHAKSSWENAELSDPQRPLLEKGKKRTKLIIDYFLNNDLKVDLIISSPAVRAYDTAKIIAHALSYPEAKIIKDNSIYHANAEQLFNQFYDVSDQVRSLMIVGHNPTLTNFANHFLENKIDSLPTSGVVCVDFNTDKWDEIPDVKGKSRFVLTPKMLKEQKSRKA